jgi:hypothetical protein
VALLLYCAPGLKSKAALSVAYGMPGKGWNTLLRLYSPLEPFFTKQWRPSEIEVVAG